jgi:hypothetical protein
MNSLFGLNGIGGLLIAVALLLSLVGLFGTLAVQTQAANADKPYSTEGYENVKMFSTGNAPHQIEKK